jgi:hypothetical protein
VAYTQEQLESKIIALETAMSRGELTVEYSDRRVTYVNTEELKERIWYFTKLLNELTGTAGTPRPKQSFAVAGKGFN